MSPGPLRGSRVPADRARLGRRLREARVARRLTLKDVELASGFSATHISEIERARTSPTIGALVRIAAALGTEPGAFLDPEPARRMVSARGVASASAVGRSASLPLTADPSGATLQARRIELPPGGRTSLDGAGERCAYVLAGRAILTVGDRTWALGEGEAFHCAAGVGPRLEASAESVTLLVVTRYASSS